MPSAPLRPSTGLREDHAEPARSPRCNFLSRTRVRPEQLRLRVPCLSAGARAASTYPLSFPHHWCRRSLPGPSAADRSPGLQNCAPHTPTSPAPTSSRAKLSNQPGWLIRASYWSPSGSLIGCFLSNKVPPEVAGAVTRALAHFPFLLVGRGFEAVSEAGSTRLTRRNQCGVGDRGRAQALGLSSSPIAATRHQKRFQIYFFCG